MKKLSGLGDAEGLFSGRDLLSTFGDFEPTFALTSSTRPCYPQDYVSPGGRFSSTPETFFCRFYLGEDDEGNLQCVLRSRDCEYSFAFLSLSQLLQQCIVTRHRRASICHRSAFKRECRVGLSGPVSHT